MREDSIRASHDPTRFAYEQRAPKSKPAVLHGDKLAELDAESLVN